MPVKSLLSPQVKAILDEAVSQELYASHLYRHVANQCQRLGYFGAQKFFASESADELEHYQLHADYQNDRGATAAIPSLPAITDRVASFRAAIELGYETEVALGEKYADWYARADVTTQQFLLQFIEIQRKSIGEYGDLISRLDRSGDDECGIIIIDQEIGSK